MRVGQPVELGNYPRFTARASIRGFTLGVAIRGSRNLTLSWEPPNRYSNEAATVRSIRGEVKI